MTRISFRLSPEIGKSKFPSAMRYLRLAILFALLCLPAKSLLAQPVLTVTFQETNLVFTATQFAALPHTEIKAMDPHEKKEHQYSVVSVRELDRKSVV